MDQTFITEIRKILPDGAVYVDEPLSRHTSFRTGGPADLFVDVPDTGLLKKIISLAFDAQITYYIIGNGSNMLVADDGYRGMILRVKTQPDLIFEDWSNIVRVSAGCSLAKLACGCAERGLAGLEFAAGIPGSVGGAVVMNAGAYGGEISDCITSAGVMDSSGGEFRLSRDELGLGYRTSVIPERNLIVTDAVFELKEGNREESSRIISELALKRREKQPLEYPSAGSTFKRPEGYFAGKLIEDSGLKGFSIGGAQVSGKHAGFVINTGHASSADIIGLIREVQKRVFENFGVKLEPEVKMLGF